MKIKLIFPGRKLRETETVIKHNLVPSETLTAVAAATPAGHEVTLVDEGVQPLDLDDRPDLVGITVYTFLAPRAYEIADHYRARGVHVVLGGLHVTSIPEDARPHADTLILGEAETVWPQFLRDMEGGSPQRVYGPVFPGDLDALPLPRKELARCAAYMTTASITATRGCPHLCSFCHNNVRPKAPYRRRSIESIASQVAREGDGYYIFFDDNLTVDKDFVRRLCRALKPLGVRWRCATNIALAYDEELVRLMAESGCDGVFIGFESVNTLSLSESGKRQNHTRDYERLIGVFHRNRILITGSFIFGFDHDGPDVFRGTVRFAIRNRIGSVTFHILTPFPGTDLFRRLDGEGRLITRDWGLYDTGHAVFRPANMTAEQLDAGYRRAYREFYSWPSILRRLTWTDVRFAAHTLAFNIALHRVGVFWRLLRSLGLLRRAFHLYYGKARPAHGSSFRRVRGAGMPPRSEVLGREEEEHENTADQPAAPGNRQPHSA